MHLFVKIYVQERKHVAGHARTTQPIVTLNGSNEPNMAQTKIPLILAQTTPSCPWKCLWGTISLTNFVKRDILLKPIIFAGLWGK